MSQPSCGYTALPSKGRNGLTVVRDAAQIAARRHALMLSTEKCQARPRASVLQVLEHGHVPTPMAWVSLLLLVAAFLPPAPRVAGFVAGGGIVGAPALGVCDI